MIHFFNKVFFVLIIFIVILQLNKAYACTIVVTSYKGCQPMPLSFSFQSAINANPVSWQWDFDDNSSSQDQNPTHVYQRGNWRPKVEVTFDNDTSCIAEIDQPIRIYDTPNAGFEMPEDTIKCISGNKFCFTDLSTPGLDNAPVTAWVWEFDDGDTAASANPCHSFLAPGEYIISLQVIDSNNCRDFTEQRHIHVIEDIQVWFHLDFDQTCPFRIARFTNMSDFTENKITEFYWDFDDGTIDSSQNNWTDFTHDYDLFGVFSPKLSVVNEYGCTDTFEFRPPFYSSYLQLDVKRSDSVLCLDNNNVWFSQTPPDSIAAFEWEFDDPPSGPENINWFQWNPGHEFTNPGHYNIKFEMIDPNCKVDSIYCGFVEILGPKAVIRDYNSKRCPTAIPFPEGTFPEKNNSCNSIFEIPTYYVIPDTNIIPNGDTTFIYCNAAYINNNNDTSWCEKFFRVEYSYRLEPTDTIIRDDTIIIFNEFIWNPGDPYPVNPYKLSSTLCPGDPGMSDTDLVKPNCSAPNLVRFSNFSVKYRGYEAIDNIPPGSPDQCLTPNYPYASDSMLYFWNFGDPYAPNCTSTTANPDVLCNYSTEVAPSHFYSEESCYFAKLTVTDTITGCISETEVIILMQPPMAGWNTDLYDFVDFDIQSALSGGTGRGFRLEGEKCIGNRYMQILNLDELIPNCGSEEYWVVFDSIDQMNIDVCHDTLVRPSTGIRDSIVSDTLISWNWLHVDDIPYIFGTPIRFWIYNKGGCKSVGVIMGSGECRDTAWYHNYKCYTDMNARFTANPISPYCSPDHVSFRIEDTSQKDIKLLTFLVFPMDGIKDTFWYEVLPFTVDGGDTSANLNEVFEFTFQKPGKYNVIAMLEHKNGCILSWDTVVYSGVRTVIDISEKTPVCVGDSVTFSAKVNYWLMHSGSSDIYDAQQADSIQYWIDPIGERNGRTPDFIEAVYWDLNSDGNINDTGLVTGMRYYDVGNYDVTVYVLDSNGCVNTFVYNKAVMVVDVFADFDVDINSSRLNSCAPTIIGFENKSELLDDDLHPKYINHQFRSFEWDFGDGKKRSFLENPIHVYNNNGAYDVMLIVESSQGCIDTMIKPEFIVIDGPMPRFEIISDTFGCVPFTVQIKDHSKDVSIWQWHLGDGRMKITHGDTLIELTYPEPGIYSIKLDGLDSVFDIVGGLQFCSDTYPDPDNPSHPEFLVNVLPINKVDFKVPEVICAGQFVHLKNLSENIYTNWFWWFGLSDSSYRYEPFVIYPDTGIYTITLHATEAPCPDSAEKSILVTTVKAGLEVISSASEPPYFEFDNLSENATNYVWKFGDGYEQETDRKVAVGHTYYTPGIKEVCILAKDDFDCRDIACLTVQMDTMVHIPNIFTPDGDNKNDVFFIDIEGATDFELNIKNRWGEQVFHSLDAETGWDGTNMNNGNKCAPGTYFYILRYRLIGGKNKYISGTVTLIR